MERYLVSVYVSNTYAPVVKSDTVRLLLALATMHQMHVHQLDVASAFGYADTDDEGDTIMYYACWYIVIVL